MIFHSKVYGLREAKKDKFFFESMQRLLVAT